ncbi:MAG TPA: 5-formyltetrahydrofolate cyclo-ligase [Mobilitalea sp.]|nr:5-formyltetrahydrofolate cyclo-ligase [Mobilitalea sp.]
MTKAEIRSNMKTRRNTLSEEEVVIQCKQVQDKLFSLLYYQKCPVLLTYLSFQAEIDTTTIIRDALSSRFIDRKKVYIPRVEKNGMDFYRITSLNDLKASKFGVLEPQDSNQNCFIDSGDDKQPKLMLLPGLAFDYKGNRVGFGAGYYDRYLAKHQKDGFIKVALAYDFQILDKIDCEDHDIKADMVITPERIIHCNIN